MIGISLIGALFIWVDWKATIQYFGKIKSVPVILAFLALNGNIFISSLKWKILLKAKGIIITWWELARCYWISTFFGNYLPTSIGGDIVRLMMFKNLGQSASVAASIVWERMTGFLILLGWSMLVLIMKSDYFEIGSLYIFLWFLVAAGFIAIAIVIFSGKKLALLFERLAKSQKGFFGKFFGKLFKFSNAVNEYHDKKRAILVTLLLSIPFYLIGVVCNYLIFISLGGNVAFGEVLAILPIIYLISLMPISLNGLGLSEGAFVILFSQVGVATPLALAAAVVRRVIHLMVSLIGGLLWIPARKYTTL